MRAEEEQWVEDVIGPIRSRIRQLEDDNSQLRHRVKQLQAVFYPDDKAYLRPTSSSVPKQYPPATTCTAAESEASLFAIKGPNGATPTNINVPPRGCPTLPNTPLQNLPPNPPSPGQKQGPLWE